MRLQIGRQPARDGNRVVTALAECHTRIRHFTDLADRLAGTSGEVSDAEVAEAARAVARYFEVALPLHEADEEESIRPRLVGRSPETDAALEEMTRQHSRLHGPVATLVETTTRIAESPGRLTLPECRTRLAETVSVLVPAWNEHLGLEEDILFPALDRLMTAEEIEDVGAEIGQRRGEDLL
jgi:hemerythrin-like domain-containing protein